MASTILVRAQLERDEVRELIVSRMGDGTPETEHELCRIAVRDLNRTLLSPDGTRLLTQSMQMVPKPVFEAQLWNAQTGALLATLPVTGGAAESLFSPDSSKLVMPGPTLELRDARSGRLLKSLVKLEELTAYAFTPDGARLLVIGRNGAAQWTELATGKETPAKFATGKRSGQTAVLSPDGWLLALFDGAHPRFTLWDTASGMKWPYVVKGLFMGVLRAVFSRDGAQLAIADLDTVQIWDVAGARFAAVLVGGQFRPGLKGKRKAKPFEDIRVPAVCAFSPDGQRLCTRNGTTDVAAEANRFNIWDLRTGLRLREIAQTGFLITSAPFPPEWDVAPEWDAAPARGGRSHE